MSVKGQEIFLNVGYVHGERKIFHVGVCISTSTWLVSSRLLFQSSGKAGPTLWLTLYYLCRSSNLGCLIIYIYIIRLTLFELSTICRVEWRYYE